MNYLNYGSRYKLNEFSPHHILIVLSIILLWGFSILKADQIFVSPDGSNDNDGLSMAEPKKTISAALAISKPGDELRLLPGTYTGTSYINGFSGEPENPLIITSHFTTLDSMAIIDGELELIDGLGPTGQNVSELANYGFEVRNSFWINFENLKFINCWAHVIVIRTSAYITIRNCDIRSGKRAIYVRDNSNHILVEDNYWELDQRVWDTWDWASLHHGIGGEPVGVAELSHFNGALLHTKESAGSLVMRRNILKNIFNGFRTKPASINDCHNVEIYENEFINIRDNVLEPEIFAYNLHFYHNNIYNSHKSFSIDDVAGGLIYIYGNVQYQEKDPIMGPHVNGGDMDGITGIWKYKYPALLTEPCYAFNNSFYTHATAFLEGEATNQMMKHFNNVYEFFSSETRSGTMGLSDWHSSFEFNFDAINDTSWPANIVTHDQEKNGVLTDSLFVDGLNGNLQLISSSPCIDAGKVMAFPELDWVQSYSGIGPDMGAYEGLNLVEGPPFRFMEPPGGAGYKDRPRIVRHYIKGNQVTLYFSSPVEPGSIRANEITIISQSSETGVVSADFPNNYYELILNAAKTVTSSKPTIKFKHMPIGQNGQFATSWASVVDIIADSLTVSAMGNHKVEQIDNVELQVYPNPSNSMVIFKINLTGFNNNISKIPLIIYDILGKKVKELSPQKSASGYIYKLESGSIASGVYIASFNYHAHLRTTKFIILR